MAHFFRFWPQNSSIYNHPPPPPPPPPHLLRWDTRPKFTRVGLPQCPTSHHFIYQFWKKKVSYASLELYIPYNYSKCADFRIWIKYKTTAFSRFFHSHKISSVGPFGLFYRPKWQISLPSHILPPVRSLPFHGKARKKYPFRAEPPRIGNPSGHLSTLNYNKIAFSEVLQESPIARKKGRFAPL